jgi:hypothetical protein
VGWLKQGLAQGDAIISCHCGFQTLSSHESEYLHHQHCTQPAPAAIAKDILESNLDQFDKINS